MRCMYLHLDMDYFFAQVEELRHPEAAGKVVVVCVYSGRTSESGAVSTVNYMGRERGIRSGMPIIQAKHLAPEGSIFLPVDKPHYAQVSARIDSMVRARCQKVAQMSIDEWNVEDEHASEQARPLKERIREEMGLTCTVCVAPSILGAKMGAASVKPDGLLHLDAQRERELIEGSPLRKVPGIGPRTAEALSRMGLVKVGDLRAADPVRLSEVFGKKAGGWLHSLGQGVYGDGLDEEKEQEEVSRIGTLKAPTQDAEAMLSRLAPLEADAKAWLMERKRSYRTLTIIFITKDMRTHTRSMSFRNPRGWREDIGKDVRELMHQ